MLEPVSPSLAGENPLFLNHQGSPLFRKIILFLFFNLAVPDLSCSMWDLVFLIKDRTQAPCIGSTEP